MMRPGLTALWPWQRPSTADTQTGPALTGKPLVVYDDVRLVNRPQMQVVVDLICFPRCPCGISETTGALTPSFIITSYLADGVSLIGQYSPFRKPPPPIPSPPLPQTPVPSWSLLLWCCFALGALLHSHSTNGGVQDSRGAKCHNLGVTRDCGWVVDIQTHARRPLGYFCC